MSIEHWLDFSIVVRDDLPAGWVFITDAQGRLVPVMAYRPDEIDAKPFFDASEAAESAPES